MSSQDFYDSQDFKEEKPTKARYSKTSMKKKQQLIEMVTKENYSIYKASKKLKISNSTAKAVLKNYEKLGIILQRNSKTSVQRVVEKKNEGSSSNHQSEVSEQKPIVKKEQAVEDPIIIKQEPKVETGPELNPYPQQYSQTYPFLHYSYPFFYHPFMP